jgi:riboflavin kinase/FMN adenylyltransferase
MPYTRQLKPLYTQSGVVENGTAVAREVGFPTVNVSFDAPEISAGTYAGKVVAEDVEYRAAVYVNQVRKLLEAHLIGFSGNLYGKEITITLLEKLVESKEFQSVHDQKSFIAWAVGEVEKYFNERE